MRLHACTASPQIPPGDPKAEVCKGLLVWVALGVAPKKRLF